MFHKKLIETLKKTINNLEKEITDLKLKVEQRDLLISDMQKQAEVLYEENKDLRFENEEQADLIKRIGVVVDSNKYNNEKVVLDKIKELVSDYQSIN